jgi:hypothetical protein
MRGTAALVTLESRRETPLRLYESRVHGRIEIIRHYHGHELKTDLLHMQRDREGIRKMERLVLQKSYLF